MSCSGLHCAGCAGGAAVPVVPLAVVFSLAWIAEHLVEVIVMCGVSGTLAVLVVVALMRWGERQDARRAQIWAARKAAASRPSITATVIPQASRGTALAIENHVHYHYHGERASPEPARVIRTALPGQAGAAITTEE